MDEKSFQEISAQEMFEKKPMVSVHMLTYNHEPYISQAIEGVVKQETKYSFELVIGEDCSTDGTREIVLAYQKMYPSIIRVITSDINIGAKKNSLRTSKVCLGKYLAICEGDDFWTDPHKLQKQVDYLESHPKCGLISADCDIYYDNSQTIKKGFNFNNGFQSIKHVDIEQILWGEGKFAVWTCTVMVRRCLFDQVRASDPYLHQNENLPLGDLQTWAELSVISDVIYFPETYATYRVLDESASRSSNLSRHYRFHKSIYEIKLYLCDKYKLPDHRRKMAESSWCDTTLRLAFHEGNAVLATKVRQKRRAFTLKEWLRYQGAKHSVIRYSYLSIATFVNLFKKREERWP